VKCYNLIHSRGRYLGASRVAQCFETEEASALQRKSGADMTGAGAMQGFGIVSDGVAHDGTHNAGLPSSQSCSRSDSLTMIVYKYNRRAGIESLESFSLSVMGAT